MPRLKSLFIAGLLATAPLWQPRLSLAEIAQTVIAQATATARTEYRQQQVRQVRPENYDLRQHPLTDANEDFWRNILWTTAIVEPQEEYVGDALAQLVEFTSQTNLSNAQTRTVDMAMQVGTQLYLHYPSFYTRLESAFVNTIEQSQDPIWVAMAFSALARAGTEANQLQQWASLIQQRFPQWREEVSLNAVLQEASSPSTTLPPLEDLLNWTIASNQLQLYVFCRPDRTTLCQTALKDAEGNWVRQEGKIWSVPLLLRSIHNLSWVFTRGQTPQGIYRIEGTVPQPDQHFFRAYGLFPLVKLFVPLESGVQEFVPGQRGSITGGLAAYQSLLPPSWRNYFPMQQTYWAGKAGRGLFRIHGSGEAPDFFSNNQLYPLSAGWNPTIGCLSALELYDDTGRLQQADMPRLLENLKAIGGQNFQGYLIVVDLPGDANVPVSLDEIEATLYSSSSRENSSSMMGAGSNTGQ